jgi:hypothetical protein
MGAPVSVDDMDDEIDDFELEWENYFDDLDGVVSRLDDLAAQAQEQGFAGLEEKLTEAADALMRHCASCAAFLDLQALNLTAELYKQNPLLKAALGLGR